MDFANRGNRPTQGQQQSAQQSAPSEQPQQSFQPTKNIKKSGKGFDFGKFTSVFILIAGSLLLLAVLIGLVFGDSTGNAEEEQIQEERYQAVFLDSADGQVYFGKLDVYNSDLYVLTDIYYVRVEQPIQPEGVDQISQPNISLAKLGNELHGPQDVMYINREKVLYWENLKDDGQVVTAITEFKANGEQPVQQQQQQQQQVPTPPTSGTQPQGSDEVDDTPDTTPETPDTTTP